jgi:serine/threonine-protein kinase
MAVREVRDALENLFRYELLCDKPIDGGGCGSIWHAHDLLFDRDVAIKTIQDRLLANCPERAVRTFKKEAVAGARLGELSRHIVKVFDLGITEGIPFFAMEWIEPEKPEGSDGIDLSCRMGAFSLAKAKAIMFEVCDALELAHKQGIVHSDIAPWNIIYDAANRVYKLTDFGLLKIVEECLVSKGSGSLLSGGRRDFQPPEVRQDYRRINRASDVFALAVTFRVLLEGDNCLSYRAGHLIPTPRVVGIRHEQRDAPPQVYHLLSRFIDNHTENDAVVEFVERLQRVPN